MIAHGLPIYVALEPVDMRLGSERLGALVRERMRAEPRSRALFVFVGKRGHSVPVGWTWGRRKLTRYRSYSSRSRSSGRITQSSPSCRCITTVNGPSCD